MIGLGFYYEVILAAIVILYLYSKHQRPRSVISGVYRQDGKFSTIKFILIAILLRVRQVSVITRQNFEPPGLEDLDQPQPLSYHKNAIDAVYFNGSSEDQQVVMCGMARRKNNLVNGFLYLRIPDFSDKFLLSPKLPDTNLYQTESDANQFKAEGISLKPIVPMKTWKITYKGKMQFDTPKSETFDVELNATFTTNLPAFNYDTDMHFSSAAKAISREYWSREYFDNLKSFHQTHYEQYGDIKGYVLIDDEKFDISVNSVRDHSFGLQRDWRVFHRYVMHFFTLEDGTRISVGVISIPVTFSSITVGFVTDATSKKNHPITDCNFKLYQHGENGNPPKNYAFSFTTEEKSYLVEVKAFITQEFFIGLERESRVIELLSQFTVNGVKGWGAAEWQYRNLTAKPQFE
ncbi:uncharacterized protein LOC132262432 [Phlebotomus argentipes]|uniref:uncharacterized protein LOC132262432 n=1 Tax=Phlebotomus argentipes TaxID=94469 RepID=UPI002892ECED|nr:uncharacterized protein LOC132262432 [Phlebotomus argentipes]